MKNHGAKITFAGINSTEGAMKNWIYYQFKDFLKSPIISNFNYRADRNCLVSTSTYNA